MELVIWPIVIFLMRIGDVTLGTLRVIELVRGHRLKAAGLGFVEATIFLLAIGLVFTQGALDNWVNMAAYAGGYAAGTAMGITVENFIASGHVILRVISREHTPEVLDALRHEQYGVTVVAGQGMDGDVQIIFFVVTRKRAEHALTVIQRADERAFVTIEPVTRAINGFIPHAAMMPSVRK